jgi:hypothetical protein
MNKNDVANVITILDCQLMRRVNLSHLHMEPGFQHLIFQLHYDQKLIVVQVFVFSPQNRITDSIQVVIFAAELRSAFFY